MWDSLLIYSKFKCLQRARVKIDSLQNIKYLLSEGICLEHNFLTIAGADSANVIITSRVRWRVDSAYVGFDIHYKSKGIHIYQKCRDVKG